jgi:hypothetical protein
MDSQSSPALFDSVVPYLPLGRHSSFQLQHVAVTAEGAIVTIGHHWTAPDCLTSTVPYRPFVACDIAELPNLGRWREAGRTIPWAATSTSHSASGGRSCAPWHALHVLCRTEPQLVEQPFEAVVDRFPWTPVASIAIVSTPASLNHAASSPRPLAVVANDCLVTSTDRSGCLT